MRIEKLFPAYKDYIWGGNKLKEKYLKDTTVSPCAESWELSAHPDGESSLSDGRGFISAVSADELGSAAARFDRFPMLIKYIDAADDLSVQVHPSDEYALGHESSLGKTELWYVIEAEEGAGLYVGFKEKLTKEEFKSAIEENRLLEKLNFFPVKAGDSFFIPAGTVHAIGRGCLICEIQQNSNITYRVYDHGRVGKDGKPRELHIEKALDVSVLEPYEQTEIKEIDGASLLGECDYFSSSRVVINGKKKIKLTNDSFTAICCISGEGKIASTPIRSLDTFFVSACNEELELCGNMTLIISCVPRNG